MDKLTVPQAKKLADLEARIDAFQVAYMDAGMALMSIRDLKLYREVAATFEAYAKERYGYSRRHVYRLIEAYDAVRDTQDVMCPIGHKVLPAPGSESVAREVAKAVSPEKRADLWAEANKNKSPGNVTAAHVRKVRERLWPVEPEDNGQAESEPHEAAADDFTSELDDVSQRIRELAKLGIWQLEAVATRLAVLRLEIEDA